MLPNRNQHYYKPLEVIQGSTFEILIETATPAELANISLALYVTGAVLQQYLSSDNIITKYHVRRIRLLTINPFAGDIKPLKGTKSTYRCRIGDFRIIYTIDKAIRLIAITAILPRGEAYK